MDVYCERCGEPYELLGITSDFTDEEKKRFWAGQGCPCCYGKPAPEKKPFRCELQEALEGSWKTIITSLLKRPLAILVEAVALPSLHLVKHKEPIYNIRKRIVHGNHEHN